ncbi:hypothetical protein [Blastopirellula marina]|uniref:Uncharacterized protein n=1 Tax=Blastopirellula marina DSM 3645 TaxID=314230 RepID=A3ZX31_9BACT|nr:hypothetical protein [Blastopirellula marina]EAQ78908.1 hypothetical protein DSM3645_27548 [Blastopirellula marina DSM 3645]
MISVAAWIVSWTGTILIAFCCFIVLIKCIWNIGLPYAMLLSKEERGWSTFPVIEVVPLIIALSIAWLTEQAGLFSVLNIAKIGVILIVATYIHFCAVSIIVGIWQYKQVSTKKDRESDVTK